MKKMFSFFLSALLISGSAFTQTIFVGGQCMTGSISLNYAFDEAGKPAYIGTGTVQGISNVQVAIFWIGAPENLWVIAFDGQPYFQNTCNTATPPGTALASCTWTAVSGTVCTGANPLSVTGAVVVPVSLHGFAAFARGSNIVLNWNTSQEINNKGFYVQRSVDGVNWITLGFVDGQGNSQANTSYQFVDANPVKGNNFYRLQQEDLDSRISYSNIVKAGIENKTWYSLSDNPGPGLYKINMAPANSKLEITVSDLSGKIIYNAVKNVGVQVLDLTSQPAGIYMLRLKIEDIISTEKIIKL